MPSVAFEPAVPTCNSRQNYVLNRTATRIVIIIISIIIIISSSSSSKIRISYFNLFIITVHKMLYCSSLYLETTLNLINCNCFLLLYVVFLLLL